MRFLGVFALFAVICGRPQEKENQPPHPGNPDEWTNFYQGDILPPLPKMSATRNGLIDESMHWVDGIVYYTFDPTFVTDNIPTVMQAMEEYKTTSGGCIQFVERTTESNYINFENEGDGCYSNVGMIGGQQTINYPQWCIDRYGSVLHEMYHALGFYHEQSRYDRDDYVTINWDNIELLSRGNFVKEDNLTVSNYGEEYDYLSVMHYSQYGFAIDSSIPTIYTKDPEYQDLIGQRDGLTQSDWNKVLRMYNCI